jgi:ribosomal protein L30/L7E
MKVETTLSVCILRLKKWQRVVEVDRDNRIIAGMILAAEL